MIKKLRGLIALTAVTAILSNSVSVYAAGGSTTINVKVTDSSTYKMIIPATTTVTDYGYTELSSNIKIKGSLSTRKVVNVTISSENDYKFVNADKTKSMAYSLKQTSDGEAVSALTFNSTDVTATGAPGKTLGVYVEKEAWNAVPEGDYSDVLTFTAELENKPEN